MFFSQRASREVAAFPGAVRRQVAVGASSQIMSFHLKKGAVVPPHSHPHEQLGMVISGRVLFRVGPESSVLGPGDGYSIPSGVEHTVDILEDSVVIDVFAPPRDDYRDP